MRNALGSPLRLGFPLSDRAVPCQSSHCHCLGANRVRLFRKFTLFLLFICGRFRFTGRDDATL